MLSSFPLSLLRFLLGIPPCRFCSSTAECLVVASCHQSHQTSDYSGILLHMLLFLLCIAVLTVDAILRFALILSSLPLFHYGLRCRVLTTLYIQRLSL